MKLKAPRTDKIWIVIPGYNEAKYIGRVLKKAKKTSQNLIFVDDGSSDRCAAIARKYTPHVLVHEINLGKGAALKTGCEYAVRQLGAQAIIIMDADDQHDPAELKLFFEKFHQGFDVIFGVRSMDMDMPFLRIFANRLASFLVYVFFGRYIPDIPSGYKAFTSRVYPRLVWRSAGYTVEMELAVRVAKYQINFTTVPIKTIYHDFDKGMTMLHTFTIIGNLFNWRISL